METTAKAIIAKLGATTNINLHTAVGLLSNQLRKLVRSNRFGVPWRCVMGKTKNCLGRNG